MFSFIILIYLAYQSFVDLKNKSVTIKSVLVFSVCSIILNIWRQLSIPNMLLGVSVGIGVCLLSLLFKNSIGMGDGAILCSIGILLGGKACFIIFLIAITLSAFIGMFLLLLKKVKIKQELPFIPYILCAYVLWLIEIKII